MELAMGKEVLASFGLWARLGKKNCRGARRASTILIIAEDT